MDQTKLLLLRILRAIFLLVAKLLPHSVKLIVLPITHPHASLRQKGRLRAKGFYFARLFLASTVSDNLLSFLFLFFCSVSCFPLVAFKIFSFSSGSQQFIMMCLGVLFLCLFCLESVAFLGSVLCRLLSTWKISNHCIFKCFFCPRTLLLSWRYHLVLSHGSLMFVHFFPLCILFWVVSIVLSSQLLIFLLENLISC